MKKSLTVLLFLIGSIIIHAAESSDANMQANKEKVVSMFDNGYCPIENMFVLSQMNNYVGRRMIAEHRISEIVNIFEVSKHIDRNCEYVASSKSYGDACISKMYTDIDIINKEIMPMHINDAYEGILYGLAAIERSLTWCSNKSKDIHYTENDIMHIKNVEKTRRSDIFLMKKIIESIVTSLEDVRNISCWLQVLQPTHERWRMPLKNNYNIHPNSAYTELSLALENRKRYKLDEQHKAGAIVSCHLYILDKEGNKIEDSGIDRVPIFDNRYQS
jgi:hypothetical protein